MEHRKIKTLDRITNKRVLIEGTCLSINSHLKVDIMLSYMLWCYYDYKDRWLSDILWLLQKTISIIYNLPLPRKVPTY